VVSLTGPLQAQAAGWTITPKIQVDIANKHFDAPRTEVAPIIDGIVDGDPAWLGAHQLANKHFDAPRTEVTPIIDGIVDGDPAWLGAHQIDDFYQVQPNEYLPASEKTEVLVTYDSNNLYVAARLYYRNKEDLIANILRQGEGTGSDDRLGLILDPFGDGRRGYIFILNRNSVRADSLFVGTSNTQSNWEGIWQGQATDTEYGWSVEMQIPFKTLSFDPNATTWGINFRRDHELTSERMGWYSQNQAMNPGTSGTMTALRDINQGLGLDVEPSISSNKHKNNVTGESSSTFQPSMDVFYKITPELNTALTINTDFSATEVDDRQVNLTQFSLFFPEKREFFLRDFDIFDFGNIGANEKSTSFSGAERQNGRPFFSRKIGLARSGEPIGLDAGVKISGGVAGLNVGGLAIRQEEFATLNATDMFVGRLTKDVFQESSIGVIYTDGDPRSNANNSLVGADFRYRNTRLGRSRAFTADAWYQQTSGDLELDDEYALGVKLAVPSTIGFGGHLQYQEVAENFNPALGFVTRKGVNLKRAKVFHSTRSVDGVIQQYNPSAEYISWEYLDNGQVQTRISKLQLLDATNQSGDRIWGYWSRRKASVRGIDDQPLRNIAITVPTGNYQWTAWALGISTSSHRRIFTSTRAFFGGYYGGTILNARSDVTWRPSQKFSFSLGVQHSDVDLPQGRFITRLNDFTATWVFSSKLSWSNLVQYDNISENLGFNSRLHWIPTAGQDVFLVFNQGWQYQDLDNSFTTTESDLTFKASYAFRF
jgi:hypothetical protein